MGYRINSLRATQFRQWATKVLRTFTLQGYVLDKKRLENEIAKAFAESEIETQGDTRSINMSRILIS